MTYDLTTDQIDGLVEMCDQAEDLAREYQTYGDPGVDYAEEWPEVAQERARRFRNAAGALRVLRGTPNALADALDDMAVALEASAREYKAQEAEKQGAA